MAEKGKAITVRPTVEQERVIERAARAADKSKGEYLLGVATGDSVPAPTATDLSASPLERLSASPEERQAIERAAERKGVSVGDWLLETAMQRIKGGSFARARPAPVMNRATSLGSGPPRTIGKPSGGRR